MAIGIVALAAALAASVNGGSDERPPRGFFGIAPQTPLEPEDVAYMRAGGIGTVRLPLTWAEVEPEEGVYHWEAFDQAVRTAAEGGLRVLPFFYGTPEWLADEATALPVATARERAAWVEFVSAAVRRYEAGGRFWREHARGSPEPVPEMPIGEWQIWNEANFFYFATPASPRRYARLLEASSRAIERLDPDARVILSGLFAYPAETPPDAMPAARFLNRLYAVPGIRGDFDGVALHPYAPNVETLEAAVTEVREVTRRQGDPEVGLYITEIGWGSQADSDNGFEKGADGQARELRDAYDYLIDNRRELGLRAVYWFSWKDVAGACNFCDSVGLFQAGGGLTPKPAWEAFAEISGGRPAP